MESTESTKLTGVARGVLSGVPSPPESLWLLIKIWLILFVKSNSFLLLFGLSGVSFESGFPEIDGVLVEF